ncbi:MAG: sugar phosphate isomerase/epimerase family protein [Planctomycetota bacterium]|jgi:hexulose-6-phosphate isomerase|nr:sugar phosphate isomerase/epimerase family protein [Planctomycetota bacterium]MDP6762426.1 sugar phosphate isomerase/epimerase family protein [Planctomycetota bacterium]MDP6988727.1 sugar phosphate isomerase/epimerase family protein [Planctomycetota bacterium]
MLQPLDRRELCRSAVALSLWGFVDPQFPPPPRPERLDLAARLSMAPPEGSLEERFALLKAAGFVGVELDYSDDLDPREVVEASGATGLTVHGLRDAQALAHPLSSDDPNVRTRGRETLERALRFCKAVGGSGVGLLPGEVTAEISYARAWNHARVELAATAPLAESLGLRIGLENGPNRFLLSPLEAARFVDELASPVFGWHLDVAWSLALSWPQHWIHVLGERLLKVELADFSQAASESAGFSKGFEVALGQGDCQWEPFLEALAHARYRGWVTLDVPGGDAGHLGSVVRTATELLGR